MNRDDKNVEACLMHNGALYAKTVNLEGVLVEVCKLPEMEAAACKYYQFVRANGYPPVHLCLYEVCTYENGGHDIFPNVHIGEDFIMKSGEDT
jgi:hypothetical protein